MQLIQQLIDTHFTEAPPVVNSEGHQLDVKHIVDTLGNLLTIPLFYKVIGVRKEGAVPLLRTDPGIIGKFPVIIVTSHKSRGYGWMFCYCAARHKYIRAFYRNSTGQMQFGKWHQPMMQAINSDPGAWLDEIMSSAKQFSKDVLPAYPSLGRIRAFTRTLAADTTPLSIATESFVDKLLGVNTATGYMRFLSLFVNGKVNTLVPDEITLEVAGLEIEFTIQPGKVIKHIAPSRARGYHKDLIQRLTNDRTKISFLEPFQFSMLEHLHFVISFIGAINTKTVDFPEYESHDNTYTESVLKGFVMYNIDDVRDTYLVVRYKSKLIGG